MANYQLSAPLKVHMSTNRKTKKSKYFYFNLNQYRNAHYQTLNKSKLLFKEYMRSQIEQLPKLNKIKITYTLFVPTKQKRDIANVCSVIDKYFCDSLVELGVLPDDNYDYVKKITFEYGGYKKSQGFVGITIETI